MIFLASHHADFGPEERMLNRIGVHAAKLDAYHWWQRLILSRAPVSEQLRIQRPAASHQLVGVKETTSGCWCLIPAKVARQYAK